MSSGSAQAPQSVLSDKKAHSIARTVLKYTTQQLTMEEVLKSLREALPLQQPSDWATYCQIFFQMDMNNPRELSVSQALQPRSSTSTPAKDSLPAKRKIAQRLSFLGDSPLTSSSNSVQRKEDHQDPVGTTSHSVPPVRTDCVSADRGQSRDKDGFSSQHSWHFEQQRRLGHAFGQDQNLNQQYTALSKPVTDVNIDSDSHVQSTTSPTRSHKDISLDRVNDSNSRLVRQSDVISIASESDSDASKVVSHSNSKLHKSPALRAHILPQINGATGYASSMNEDQAAQRLQQQKLYAYDPAAQQSLRNAQQAGQLSERQMPHERQQLDGTMPMPSARYRSIAPSDRMRASTNPHNVAYESSGKSKAYAEQSPDQQQVQATQSTQLAPVPFIQPTQLEFVRDEYGYERRVQQQRQAQLLQANANQEKIAAWQRLQGQQSAQGPYPQQDQRLTQDRQSLVPFLQEQTQAYRARQESSTNGLNKVGEVSDPARLKSVASRQKKIQPHIGLSQYRPVDDLYKASPVSSKPASFLYNRGLSGQEVVPPASVANKSILRAPGVQTGHNITSNKPALNPASQFKANQSEIRAREVQTSHGDSSAKPAYNSVSSLTDNDRQGAQVMYHRFPAHSSVPRSAEAKHSNDNKQPASILARAILLAAGKLPEAKLNSWWKQYGLEKMIEPEVIEAYDRPAPGQNAIPIRLVFNKYIASAMNESRKQVKHVIEHGPNSPPPVFTETQLQPQLRQAQSTAIIQDVFERKQAPAAAPSSDARLANPSIATAPGTVATPSALPGPVQTSTFDESSEFVRASATRPNSEEVVDQDMTDVSDAVIEGPVLATFALPGTSLIAHNILEGPPLVSDQALRTTDQAQIATNATPEAAETEQQQIGELPISKLVRESAVQTHPQEHTRPESQAQGTTQIGSHEASTRSDSIPLFLDDSTGNDVVAEQSINDHFQEPADGTIVDASLNELQESQIATSDQDSLEAIKALTKQTQRDVSEEMSDSTVSIASPRPFKASHRASPDQGSQAQSAQSINPAVIGGFNDSDVVDLTMISSPTPSSPIARVDFSLLNENSGTVEHDYSTNMDQDVQVDELRASDYFLLPSSSSPSAKSASDGENLTRNTAEPSVSNAKVDMSSDQDFIVQVRHPAPALIQSNDVAFEPRYRTASTVLEQLHDPVVAKQKDWSIRPTYATTLEVVIPSKPRPAGIYYDPEEEDQIAAINAQRDEKLKTLDSRVLAKAARESQKSKFDREVLGFPVYPCGYRDCTAELHDFETLVRHCDRKHGRPDRTGTYTCHWGDCDTRKIFFSDLVRWQAHMDEEHQQAIRFVCRHKGCKKAFPYEDDLALHTTTHRRPRSPRAAKRRVQEYYPKKKRRLISSDEDDSDDDSSDGEDSDSEEAEEDANNVDEADELDMLAARHPLPVQNQTSSRRQTLLTQPVTWALCWSMLSSVLRERIRTEVPQEALTLPRKRKQAPTDILGRESIIA